MATIKITPIFELSLKNHHPENNIINWVGNYLPKYLLEAYYNIYRIRQQTPPGAIFLGIIFLGDSSFL